MENSTALSKSGSKFIPAKKLSPQSDKMPSVFNWDSTKAVAKALIEELGFSKGLWIFVKSITWDGLFNKPKWHPEYFELKAPDEEKHFKKVLKQLFPVIVIFNNLKKEYGEDRAHEITAKMGISTSLPYLLTGFKPGTRIKHIDEIRQLLTDYLGDGKGFEWTEEVSEDQTEVRYRFTKCVYIMILRAYGLDAFAGHCCLADHAVFDNVMTDVIFGRKHTIGVGDTFCDHIIRLRSPEDNEKDESNYEDCHKAGYGGREAVQRWEEHYKNNDGKFIF
jgi:hypothetical protein